MALMKSITPERIQQEFEEDRLGRLRLRLRRRGALPRRDLQAEGRLLAGAAQDPQQDPDVRADRPAEDGRADLPPPARHLPGHRADRVGQDDDAGVR